MLLFLFASATLALFGLYQEREISTIDDKRESILAQKKLVEQYRRTFNLYYSAAVTLKYNSSDLYRNEPDKFKDYNLCTRNWQISKQTNSIPYFLENYKKFTNQTFYDEKKFSNISKIENNFKKWNDENKKSLGKDPCTNPKNAKYILKSSNEFISAYEFFLENLNFVLADLITEDDKLLRQSEEVSEKISNLYLVTFILLVISSIFIIFIDIRSNRGQNE